MRVVAVVVVGATGVWDGCGGGGVVEGCSVEGGCNCQGGWTGSICAGLRRSIETVSCLPLKLRVKCLSVCVMTG